LKPLIITFTTIGIALLVLIALLFDHNFSRSYHHTFTKTTDLSEENIEGLLLNTNPYREGATEQSRDVADYNYFVLREGIEIATNKTGEIMRFILTDENVETVKGIRIGDKKEEVINIYGKDNYFRTEQGFHIIGYVDKLNDSSIEFWLTDNKVDFYRFDHTSMQ
jgi:hypothetical protein